MEHSDQNGFEVVAIDRGPDVIDDGDPCWRCDAERSPGEGSWIIEYAHGGTKEVCSACASVLEVGTVDDPRLRADGGTRGSEQSDPSEGREVRKRQRLRKIERDTKEMHPYR